MQDENGAAVAGAKVSLYDQDYELIAELETDENGRAYQEKLAKGTYYAVLDGEEKEFEISSDQTVTVTLVQKTQTEQQQFDDIENHWAKEDILSMTDMGLFAGTGENKFSPDVTMSRAMLVSVLYRLNEMEPETFGVVCEEPREFSDVEAGTWYAESVAWAGGSGIVSGIGENIFEPDTSITREQLAVILYQYLQRIGMELENNPVDFNNFADSNTVASWSYDAMQYCVNVGLISGKDHNMLDPQGLLTRAEAASVLSRLIQQINNTVSE